MRIRRVLIVLLALSVTVAACSSKPSKKKATETVAPSPTPTEIAGSTLAPSSSATPTAPGTKTTAPQSTSQGTSNPSVASLFTNERVGVTSSSITICSHVPLTGAAPIAREPSQTNVYWSWLNSQGGINGRKVNSIVYDDTYTPTGAISAMEKCKSKAFLVSGYAGVDQITAVASWAKRNKIPYLHGPASASTIGTNPYQFFLAPDYEYGHQLLADYVVKVLHATKIAQVRLDSPHFAAGAKAFRNRLKSKYGISLIADEVVTGKIGETYDQLYSKFKNAEVINNFTNPTTWLTMIGKLQQLGLTTQKWVAAAPVASYNLVVSLIGESLGSRAHVFSVTPAYPSGSAEEQTFKAAFAKYGPKGKTPDDIDWAAWLFFKELAAALRAAGKNPTRSAMVAALEKMKQSAAQASPSCVLDFTRDPAAVNRRGSWTVNVFRSASTGKWTQIRTCAGAF